MAPARATVWPPEKLWPRGWPGGDAGWCRNYRTSKRSKACRDHFDARHGFGPL